MKFYDFVLRLLQTVWKIEKNIEKERNTGMSKLMRFLWDTRYFSNGRVSKLLFFLAHPVFTCRQVFGRVVFFLLVSGKVERHKTLISTFIDGFHHEHHTFKGVHVTFHVTTHCAKCYVCSFLWWVAGEQNWVLLYKAIFLTRWWWWKCKNLSPGFMYLTLIMANKTRRPYHHLIILMGILCDD